MAYKRKTVSEMSREFNCSEDDILEYLRRLGFHYVNRDSYVREDAYLSARKELSKSKSISEMSREFNCSEDDILEYLRRLGFHYVNRDSYVREDVYLSIKEEFSKPKPIEKPNGINLSDAIIKAHRINITAISLKESINS